MLLHAARTLAAEGKLPVNIRFVCDGEEELGGQSVVEYLSANKGRADACLIFDESMVERDVPCFTVATRGLAYFHVELVSGERDLHSGIYGGAAMNALNALTEMLAAVLPRDGRLHESLMAGAVPLGVQELASLAALPSGARVLEEAGAKPADRKAAEELYLRTCAYPAFDINGIEGGSPRLQKTVLPARAQANVSIRLAPGQDVGTIGAALEKLLRDLAPAGAELSLELLSASSPGMTSPDSAAIGLALDAFERAFGRRPLLVRSGGTIPIMPTLEKLGIPAIITGFDLPEGNIHSPNERLRADYLESGVTVARAIFEDLAQLPR